MGPSEIQRTGRAGRPARRSTRARLVGVGLVAIALSLSTSARADIRLPALFGDHMVLQQKSSVRVWGWGRPGESVAVSGSWAEAEVTTAVDAGGRFEVRLRTPEAGGPHRLTVRGDLTIVLDDVMVGEVWLCSGQSNMEWPVAASADAEATIDAASSNRIRLFRVPNQFAVHPRIDVAAEWQRCTPETVRDFSAVAYHFALRLERELQAPIGLIQSDWGGTVAEAWMSPHAVGDFAEFRSDLEFLTRVGDPNTRGDALEGHKERWWDLLDDASSIPANWTTADFDASEWSTQPLPATLSGDLASFDGLVYYRKTIALDADAAKGEAMLELGPIDDMDDAWVNGVRVGSEHADGRWNAARRYPIPAGTLVPGENIIAVRILDNAGPGGINGQPDQMKITRGDAKLVSLAGDWRYRAGAVRNRLPAPPQQTALHQNVPTLLYQAMIAPLTPFTIQGVIWYQGESNRPRPEQYRRLFRRLIRDWREQWGIGDFPFLYVQIAPFAYGGDDGEAALLREAQLLALEEPNTGMVVTTDVGNPSDIHPRDKRTVGDRLAVQALRRAYGRPDLVAEGPRYRHMKVVGSKIHLYFDHGAGMQLRESAKSHFVIAGKNRRFFPAQAEVDGDTIVVWSDQVAEPAAVRFGWEAAAEPNLFGRTGLPASPFRTDRWSGPAPDNSDDMQSYRSTDPDFVPLFSGYDLDGWVNVNCAPSTWTVEDGVIACSGFPTGVLRTESMYENFILELEYRHLEPGGNAGLFIWSDPLTARGQPFTRSVEVQVMDGRETDWYTSDGDIFPIHGAKMTPLNGRGGDRAYPTTRRANPAPLWNHYRVECQDGEITLSLNGEVVTRGQNATPRKGYICLESEGAPCEFRHIRLKELPASGTLTPDQVCDEARDFRPLYTGVDLSGWKVTEAHEGHWRARDWTIDFDGQGPDLWTTDSFEDFVLICDWRWTTKGTPTERPVILANGDNATDDAGNPITRTVQDAGDSGIYLRGNSKSQVNIWCWPIGSGEVYGYRTDPTQPAEVRAAVTPNEVADAPIGQWNRFVITMRGDRLTVVLNGKTVIENAQLPDVPRIGPIALQSHGSRIQFANVFILELDEEGTPL